MQVAAGPIAKQHRADVCSDCAVRDHGVCACLSDSDLLSFSALARTVSFQPGEALQVQDEDADRVFSVTAGMVRLVRLLPDGRRQIVGFALPGDFIGMASRRSAHCSAEAVEMSSACVFPRRSFDAAVVERPGLARRLHDLALVELERSQEQALLLGRRTAEERLACFLLMLQQRMGSAGEQGDYVHLPMGRQDIADYLGLTIETVSRTFSRMVRAHTLVSGPRGVRLIDAGRLELLAAA